MLNAGCMSESEIRHQFGVGGFPRVARWSRRADAFVKRYAQCFILGAFIAGYFFRLAVEGL